ncbi:MarR family transcriptional regulator [Nocardioides sp. CBS4Y-1]|uniref:MarR family transcriptional regulator n=1 Tax=Nocardioides acrostichi TaxID=2784339 RepID=A0A930UW31_9ACTN|nr:MarR family transcriptional regulator [Nocardioides acrostichi]
MQLVPDPPEAEPRWLDETEQHAWRALVLGSTLLFGRLDEELRAAFDLSMPEYEILVRLSEAEGLRLRMAQLADAMAHSRSRVTHTVSRLQKAGLVDRVKSCDDGRGIDCLLTVDGVDLLRRAAPVHVEGVRRHLVDLMSPTQLQTLGEVMDAVADQLVPDCPESEIR